MMPVVTDSEAETAAVGRRLGAGLAPGNVVLLEGPLGAGKTAFVRGLVEGLGGRPDDVTSPTFTLVQAYGGRTPVQHVDLYRLSPPEVDDLGLDELGEGAVLAVEWPDRWRDPPPDALRVTLALAGEGRRRIIIGQPDRLTRRDSSALPS